MPNIIGQAEQQRALRDIRAALKELSVVNQFLDAANGDGLYQISFSDAEGNRFRADLYSENKDDVDLFVMDFKNREKERILSLAQKYNIGLDPEDEEILGIAKNFTES